MAQIYLTQWKNQWLGNGVVLLQGGGSITPKNHLQQMSLDTGRHCFDYTDSLDELHI